jgi:hypothetical protein
MPSTTYRDLSKDHEALLIALCNRCPVPSDSLPYTREYDALHQDFISQTGLQTSRHHLWRAICRLRKLGKLESKGRTGIEPTPSN